MIKYRAKVVALGTIATVLVLVALWPLLHQASVTRQRSTSSSVEISLSPNQNPRDLSEGIVMVRVRNLTNRPTTAYVLSRPCLELLMPKGVSRDSDEGSDPVVISGYFEPVGARSFRDDRVFIRDLFTGPRNPENVGTFQCQLVYDDIAVNGISHSQHWGMVSQAGRVLGPLITIRVGWLQTSIVDVDSEGVK